MADARAGVSTDRRGWANPGRTSIAGRRLGMLEAELLEVLWRADEPLGVRELLPMLSGPRRAYTTIVTVLTRLVAKGLLERVGDGRRFCYRPSGAPDELTARAIETLLDGASDRRAVLAHLVAQIDDPGLLAELALLLREVGLKSPTRRATVPGSGPRACEQLATAR